MRNWGGILSWCVPNLPYLTKKVLCFPFAWACCQLGWLAGELVTSTPGDAPPKRKRVGIANGVGETTTFFIKVNPPPTT